MANEHGSVWVVFNGDIYNHHELRGDLECRGHVFRGHFDTEVLPHLYEEYGSDFVTHLRGMFVLAIYDTRTRALMIARDRFGIKPLFYAPEASRLAFASEIRPLLRLPGTDRQAIYDYASLASSTFLAHMSDTEGCPNVGMEAMACGRAIVGTDAGDVSSLVEVVRRVS